VSLARRLADSAMSEDIHLLIRAGRIVCPATGFDSAGTVAVCGNRIAAVGSAVEGDGRQVIDFPDAVCLPGLIDLHAHPARSGSVFGVDPDRHILARGTTTVLSQGDAGADTCEAFVRDTVEQSRTQVVLAINLSSQGESRPGGCFAQLTAADVAGCVDAIQRFRAHIWGIAVNASHHCCGGTDPREVLRRGLIAAEQSGLPILYGMRRPEDWPLEQQLALLRSGDVITYCFRRTPHCIVQNGHVLRAVREARSRGILFDVGHGCGSFDFVVAEAALQDGFEPDTISTDLQCGHLGQTPIHDLPLVMSKLRAAGMPERQVWAAATSRPAEILGRSAEIGTLLAGSRADLTLLRWQERGEPLVDVHGQARAGGRWETVATVIGGKLVAEDSRRAMMST
jgi:dihydroorotase